MEGKPKLLKQDVQGRVRTPVERREMLLAEFERSGLSGPKIVDYVANQDQRHRRKTFREEMEEFLRKAGVKYDPKYLD